VIPRVAKVTTCAIPPKGRGVRASEDIAAGELIESAATIVLSAADTERVAGTAVDDYYFAHPGNDEEGLVILGVASLCNHSDWPSAEVRWRFEDGVGWIADLVALRAVAAGEEVTRRYRCAPWFAVAS